MKYMVSEISPNQVEVWELEGKTISTAAAKVLRRLNQHYKKIDIDRRGVEQGYILFSVVLPFDRGEIVYKMQEL